MMDNLHFNKVGQQKNDGACEKKGKLCDNRSLIAQGLIYSSLLCIMVLMCAVWFNNHRVIQSEVKDLKFTINEMQLKLNQVWKTVQEENSFGGGHSIETRAIRETICACPPGERGLPGLNGLPGRPGKPGRPGLEGPAGINGRRGLTGPRGPRGPRGPQGPPGPHGPVGPQGLPGPQGSPGINGTDGKPGEDGVDGRTGPAGEDGRDGSDGSDGRPGEEGAPGRTGPAGAPGKDGISEEDAIRAAQRTVDVVYVRWGKEGCNRTDLFLYSGFAAGREGQGGNDIQCLPQDPNLRGSGRSRLEFLISTEAVGLNPIRYNLGSNSRDNTLNRTIQGAIMPCAACKRKSSTQIMVPGIQSCGGTLRGPWDIVYRGYLMTEFISGTSTVPSVHICVDERAEAHDSDLTDSSSGPQYTFVKSGACENDDCIWAETKYGRRERKIPCVVCTTTPQE